MGGGPPLRTPPKRGFGMTAVESGTALTVGALLQDDAGLAQAVEGAPPGVLGGGSPPPGGGAPPPPKALGGGVGGGGPPPPGPGRGAGAVRRPWRHPRRPSRRWRPGARRAVRRPGRVDPWHR